MGSGTFGISDKDRRFYVSNRLIHARRYRSDFVYISLIRNVQIRYSVIKIS